MPATQPQISGVRHYWNTAPEPFERVSGVVGYGLSGVAAVGATVTGITVAATSMTPFYMLRHPIGGLMLGCSAVAHTGYYAVKFTGKVLDSIIGAGNIAFNMGIYKHFSTEERQKIFAAQLFLNRYQLVLDDADLKKLFCRILYKYSGTSYNQSDASRALMEQLQDENTSLQTKLRYVLAYSWDEDNTGRNMAHVVGKELMAFHNEMTGADSQVEQSDLEDALAQILSATSTDAGTAKPPVCPLSGRIMTLPVRIPTEAPYNGDGRAYDLTSLIAYKEGHGEAKLLGGHGENMQIDLNRLVVDRDAYAALQAFNEHAGKTKPKFMISADAATAQAVEDDAAQKDAQEAVNGGSKAKKSFLRRVFS